MHTYEPRIARYLEEIASTPTGWPLVDWVRLHWPNISFGVPLTGGAFAYPWPLARVVLRDAWTEEWQREALAHELVHMIRWRGHLVGSLEQEYDAYLTAAKVCCEWNGWDWRKPEEEAIKHYPLFFGPAADKDEFKRQLPDRLAFYSVLPWDQPYTPPAIAAAMLQQSWFGVRLILTEARKRIVKSDAEKEGAK
ncbi:MAG: hypothetical protein H0T73_10535 [Ardenticatenales bacterium]|nr:hypothetical protein [Ardenticatenales bacterium]